MTTEEYNKRMKQIEQDYTLAKQKLYQEYGMSKVMFNVGDIIKDDRFTLKIDKMTVSKSFGMPQPVYSGFELKKDLSVRKDLKRVSIYGNDVKLIK